MRALRDMNLPKFVFEDVPLFLGLIADLFPGLDCPRVRYPNFNDAVEAVLVDNKYVLLPHQVTRTHPETYVSVKQGWELMRVGKREFTWDFFHESWWELTGHYKLEWELRSESLHESFLNSPAPVKRDQELHESWWELTGYYKLEWKLMRVEKREFAWVFSRLSCPSQTRTRVAWELENLSGKFSLLNSLSSWLVWSGLNKWTIFLRVGWQSSPDVWNNVDSTYDHDSRPDRRWKECSYQHTGASSNTVNYSLYSTARWQTTALWERYNYLKNTGRTSTFRGSSSDYWQLTSKGTSCLLVILPCITICVVQILQFGTRKFQKWYFRASIFQICFQFSPNFFNFSSSPVPTSFPPS
jgi:hypothetical protein